MKKVCVSGILSIILLMFVLVGCATVHQDDEGPPVDYSKPEIQKIFSRPWSARLDWENHGGLDRYVAEIDFDHDTSEDTVVARIDLTLVEAHNMSVQSGQEGKTAQWFLAGDISARNRELRLLETDRTDPNDFLTAWVTRATLTFGPEWKSFTGEFVMSDGTPINGEVFVGAIEE